MSGKDTVNIIKGSTLWDILSHSEKFEAAAYALKTAGINVADEDIKTLLSEGII
ncbi:hypothetical protein H8E50_12495 [bacterium]|nr:hypothetical protein [bacterium]